MSVSILVTPTTVAMLAFPAGIAPLIFDAAKISSGDNQGSRITRLFFDIFMCVGTGMIVAGFCTAIPPLLFTGIALLSVSALTRLVLAIIYKD
jgi:hypothetical protein